MVVQALGLALSTAEPRWSGILLVSLSLSLQPLHSFFFPPSSLLFISPLHLFSSSFSSCHFFNTDQSFVCGLVSVLPTCYWWIFSLVFFFLPVFLVGSRDAITQLVLFLPPLTTLFKFSPSQWLRNMISTMVATTVCLIC